MGRLSQIFVAPGDDDEQLLAEPSPWVLDQWVTLPLEQWRLLATEAERADPVLAEKLDLASGGGDPTADTTIHLPDDELAELSGFLRRLAGRIEAGPDLIDAPTAEIPDVFEAQEHARMLRDVAAVLDSALAKHQPFRAWSE